jgi:TRAP transporter 4TM/12TM fusion protein
MERMPQVDPVTLVQFVLGIVLLAGILELTRRTLGPAMPILALIFIAYAFIGPHMSGVLYYRGVTPERFIEQLTLTFQGVFGEALNITATFVILFILFGAFLEVSGGGEFFMDIAKSMVGRKRGGPGLMAVISSALMGTISGSAVANVVTTGVFTIPLMKKVGYEKNFAGAVEAVASTGGQIMPPVMGAGAFIMSEYIGVPYGQIALCAFIPALLYFFAVFMQIYLEARRLNLPGVPPEEIHSFWTIIRQRGQLVIAPIIMVGVLMIGFTASRAGFWGIVAVLIMSSLKKQTRMGLKKLVEAFISAVHSLVPVASACACAGIIIGVVRFSGIGLKFGSAVLSISNGNLPVALVLTMVSSMVLGMGLPTTASYIIQAALAAPALIQMGLEPIQAHLFVFYFACTATITPPVALAAYAAAPICEGNPTTVGIKAFKLGLAAYIVPYMFVYGPGLILLGEPLEIFLAFISSVTGVTILAVALTGWAGRPIPILFRLMLFAASILLMIQGIRTDLIGLVLAAATFILHLTFVKKQLKTAGR